MKNWLKDKIEWLVCRTIGCTSIWANWFEWPSKVCNPLVLRLWGEKADKEE